MQLYGYFVKVHLFLGVTHFMLVKRSIRPFLFSLHSTTFPPFHFLVHYQTREVTFGFEQLITITEVKGLVVPYLALILHESEIYT